MTNKEAIEFLKNMIDTQSVGAVLPNGEKALWQYHIEALNMAISALQLLERLPSAQPEIIRCKDCKHKHLENMVWTCPFGLPAGENFFCGYAERRTGE